MLHTLGVGCAQVKQGGGGLWRKATEATHVELFFGLGQPHLPLPNIVISSHVHNNRRNSALEYKKTLSFSVIITQNGNSDKKTFLFSLIVRCHMTFQIEKTFKFQ